MNIKKKQPTLAAIMQAAGVKPVDFLKDEINRAEPRTQSGLVYRVPRREL